jgi:hypothetical protein
MKPPLIHKFLVSVRYESLELKLPKGKKRKGNKAITVGQDLSMSYVNNP